MRPSFEELVENWLLLVVGAAGNVVVSAFERIRG